MNMLSDLYFGKLCLSEQGNASDDKCEFEKVLKYIDPEFRERIEK